MKRINVIGTSGSGKSTVSVELAEALGYPYFEMDALFWDRDWRERPNEEFFPRLQEAIRGDTWVLDGNYSRCNAIKWERVDTIVWIDYGFFRTIWQAIGRAITRAVDEEELWAGTGNRESFRQSFLSKNSVILWTLQCYRRNKVRYAALTEMPEYEHIRFVRLRSPRETGAFLSEVRKEMRIEVTDSRSSDGADRPTPS